jgi:hypothetical protein
MHNIILGKRNATAQARILSTSAVLASHFGVDPVVVTSLTVQEKDPLVKAMKEREAVADLLDGIALNLALIEPTAELIVTAETGEGLPEPVVTDKKAKGKK